MPNTLNFTDHSSREFDQPNGRVYIERSTKVWSLREGHTTLMVAGLFHPSFTEPPEMWLLLCTGFNRAVRRNIVFAREYLETVLDDFPRITAKVPEDYPAGQRLAEFMGFQRKMVAKMSDGKFYVLYEAGRVI